MIFTYKTQLYKIRPTYKGADLFTTALFNKKWDAVCDILKNDRNNKRTLEFVHPKDSDDKYKRKYSHYHRGFAILTVGKYKKRNDFATMVINLKSDNYDPYVIVIDYTLAFSNPDILAEMTERAFNYVLAESDMEVTLEPWNIDAEEEKILWAVDCVASYFAAKYDIDEQTKPLRKSNDFMEYILHKDKEQVLSVLHRVLGKQKCPKDIARPIRILCDHGVLDWPPYNAFENEFVEVVGLISESRYNHYTYELTNPYKGDSKYADVESELDMLL